MFESIKKIAEAAEKVAGCILLVCVLCALCLSMRADAATMTFYQPQELLNGGTNKVTALTTNTYTGKVLNIENQDNTAIQVSGTCLASNVASLRLDFAPTVDGSTYATTNLVSVTVAAATNGNDGAIFCVVTNIAVPGIKSLKLIQIGNLGGITIPTNLTVKGSVKR